MGKGSGGALTTGEKQKLVAGLSDLARALKDGAKALSRLEQVVKKIKVGKA